MMGENWAIILKKVALIFLFIKSYELILNDSQKESLKWLDNILRKIETNTKQITKSALLFNKIYLYFVPRKRSYGRKECFHL